MVFVGSDGSNKARAVQAKYSQALNKRSTSSQLSETFMTQDETVEAVNVPEQPNAALPRGCEAGPLMREGLDAVKFATGSHEARFARRWFSRPCEELLNAFTWHAIARHFQSNATTAERVYSSLAIMYTRAVEGGEISAEVKDTLTWYLPEALAETAVRALRTAYPHAEQSFDAMLQQKLFDEFVSWSSGFGGVRQVIDSARRPLGRLSPVGTPHAMRPGLKELLAMTPALARETFAASVAAGAASSSRADHSRRAGEADDSLGLYHRSCVVGSLPSVRREKRDVAACSPLMMQWLLLRHQETRARPRCHYRLGPAACTPLLFWRSLLRITCAYSLRVR